MSVLQTNQASEKARFNMIEQQIRPWGVLDPVVLQLLNEVPRERFISESYQGLVFADIEIPLINNQSMLAPKVEARILQSLRVKSSDDVLHIGTGSGYFAALLGKLAKQVISLEMDPELNAIATYSIVKQQITNVCVELANGINGYVKKAPYDLIVFTGSSPVEPAKVKEQLKVGGAMFIVIGVAPVMQATLITRLTEKGYRKDVLFETCIPELVGAPQVASFKF